MRPVDSCQIYSSLSHPFFLDSIDFLTPFPSTGQFILSISLISWYLSRPQVIPFSQFRWLPDAFPIHGAIHPLNFVDPLTPFPSTGQFIFPNSVDSSTTYFSLSHLTPIEWKNTRIPFPLRRPGILAFLIFLHTYTPSEAQKSPGCAEGNGEFPFAVFFTCQCKLTGSRAVP